MYTDITHSKKKNFRIGTPGTHVYYFENRDADFSFTLAHSDAKLYVFALYEGKGKDKYTLTTRQRHTVSGAQSHIMIRGIFDDASRFSYAGFIKLEKAAGNTDASLESRNILLSDNAFVSAKPSLEILPADVRCTHAATIAHLNQEHIDFLKSRGINQTEAEKLILEGFKTHLKQKLHEKAPEAKTT